MPAYCGPRATVDASSDVTASTLPMPKSFAFRFQYCEVENVRRWPRSKPFRELSAECARYSTARCALRISPDSTIDSRTGVWKAAAGFRNGPAIILGTDHSLNVALKGQSPKDN